MSIKSLKNKELRVSWWCCGLAMKILFWPESMASFSWGNKGFSSPLECEIKLREPTGIQLPHGLSMMKWRLLERSFQENFSTPIISKEGVYFVWECLMAVTLNILRLGIWWLLWILKQKTKFRSIWFEVAIMLFYRPHQLNIDPLPNLQKYLVKS